MTCCILEWLGGSRDIQMEHISTSQVDVGCRRRFWEDTVATLYAAATVTVENPRQFYGHIDYHKFGGIVLSDIRAERSQVIRESRHIGAAEDNLIQLNLQVEGTGSIVQDGREAMTAPGELVIYDSARPYQMRFDGPFRQLSVDFPRSLLRNRFSINERFTARPFSGTNGPGRFLYAYVRTLLWDQDVGDQLMAERLQDHLLDLLGTAVSGLAQADHVNSSDARSATLLRIKAYLNANLHDPELAGAAVAASQGLSLRYLYYLFEAEGTSVRRFIQDARLDHCRRAIEDPSMMGRSLTDIAFEWGFKEAAHFSRAFRKRFGMTARECRAARRDALERHRQPG